MEKTSKPLLAVTSNNLAQETISWVTRESNSVAPPDVVLLTAEAVARKGPGSSPLVSARKEQIEQGKFGKSKSSI